MTTNGWRHEQGNRKRSQRLYYCDRYVYDVVEAGLRHTFDITRPRKIHDALIACGAAEPDDFEAPHAATDAELLLVHTPAYVHDIRNPSTLARYLLLDGSHPWDENLLMPFRLATGGTVEAFQAAAFNKALGLNLSGGFHHAQADKAEGFCALADVPIAIRVARHDGFEGRVLVIDLDYHHGNGTALIFADDETVFTFSMHNVPWCFIDKKNNRDIELPAGIGDADYLGLLADELPRAIDRFEPEAAIYLAGSDPYAGDTLGDAQLSLRGLLDRDRFVTLELLKRDVPFAVVTAGGYGAHSWRVHFNYYRWLLTSAEVQGVRTDEVQP